MHVGSDDARPDHDYPRPLLRRRDWHSLDGQWDFALDDDARWHSPGEVHFDRRIEVPFAPETPRSGIGETGLFRACWYRRVLELGPAAPGECTILHFGAVDYEARVWIDGVAIAHHEGGYTPFECDISAVLDAQGRCEIVVQALDDPADLAKPRGKQDWQREPHSIWYPRTSGIWQSVWYERVGPVRIAELRWTSTLEHWDIGLEVHLAEAAPPGLRLRVRIAARGLELVDDEYAVPGAEVHRRIVLSDPGIDDSRNELAWSPESPTLLDAVLELVDAEGCVVDRVYSYTALRSFVVDGSRLLLNGRPYPLRLVLDQGYWPDTGMTAPSPAALREDIELTLAMGFNGARKHQKIEDPRYLYWADRLGLLVWVEMPSAYRFTQRSVERLTQQWLAVMRRDISHPSIVAWVPFNESWGVPNLPSSPAQRHYVRALYNLTKTIDPDRPVLGNDGWESVATDIIGIHDYDHPPSRIAKRYADRDALPRMLQRERPAGRALVLDHPEPCEQPIVLSEFGGIAVADAAGVWGYTACADVEGFERAYAALMTEIHRIEGLSGFCYTQLADTYQEANGLLDARRVPKFPVHRIAALTRPSQADVPVGDIPIDRNGPP